jgi:hypothetical protein
MAKNEVIIRARILKWGNSYGLRVRKADVKKLGLLPESEAVVRLEKQQGRVDLSGLPTFSGGLPDDSLRHDDLLGRARLKSLDRRRA